MTSAGAAIVPPRRVLRSSNFSLAMLFKFDLNYRRLNTALLTAISSPRRREILRLLWDGEQTAGAIHEAMPDVTFAAVSLQLRALTSAGLVESRPSAQYRIYRVRREAMAPVAPILEAMWSDALWRLKLKAELKETRRGPRPGQQKRSSPKRK
jgi:DNA-binding transcriptional ArsR family regulator